MSPLHPHAALIHRFYDAFDRHDGEAMAACYHPDVVFHDPVFGELRGERAADMWRMLAASATDLAVRVADVAVDDEIGSARWTATYTFGRGRRRVRNVIEARFAFRDGRIVRHDDAFSLWRWAAQALGPTGALLGWAPPVRARIRRRAHRQLDRWLADKA